MTLGRLMALLGTCSGKADRNCTPPGKEEELQQDKAKEEEAGGVYSESQTREAIPIEVKKVIYSHCSLVHGHGLPS
jgi:hypothetical protein